ncbi:hypothetical protein MAR_013959, partial [Mya arenaria]
GATYIRWGRTECNTSGTELVYRGFAGGSFYTDNGGASNYLCFPEKPEWGNYDDKENSDSALVYGGEYQLNNRESFLTTQMWVISTSKMFHVQYARLSDHL